MELHTYAKRKSSKWSIEQKRKLVMARIKYDNLFRNQSAISVLPWKKVLELAKLNNYNVFFVRKQWSGMIAKYKQYKETRLGRVPSWSIDEEAIKKITQEWEFFEPLHAFMTKRTTNLHSYALTNEEPELSEGKLECNAMDEHDGEVEDANEEPSADMDFPTEIINAYSSDTNETEYPMRYTDHDFYSKNPTQQSNYSADASEDTQESTTVLANRKRTSSTAEQEVKSKVSKLSACGDVETNPSEKIAQSPITTSEPKRLNRRQKPMRLRTIEDKYYLHRIKYDLRMERRIDVLLNIFGQIVKSNYPNVDVDALLESTAVNKASKASDVLETEHIAPRIVVNINDEIVINGNAKKSDEQVSAPTDELACEQR